MRATLLGEENQNLIQWSAEDDTTDFIASGTPQLQYANGPVSGISMLVKKDGGVPEKSDGRPLPLSYKIHASAIVPGKTVLSQHRTIRQDEIDKCRQEYIDMGVGLRDEIVRNKFTLGFHGVYFPPSKTYDCYAYIYPTLQAQKVTTLENTGHPLTVSSGYRSPRYNALNPHIQSSTNSTHIFGEAVDINPIASELNAEGWKKLWTADEATCPKSLEKTKPDGTIGTMRWCNGSQQTPVNAGSYPGSENLMYGQARCIHLGNARKDLENTPGN